MVVIGNQKVMNQVNLSHLQKYYYHHSELQILQFVMVGVGAVKAGIIVFAPTLSTINSNK